MNKAHTLYLFGVLVLAKMVKRTSLVHDPAWCKLGQCANEV